MVLVVHNTETGIDVIGDIAVIKLRPSARERGVEIAEGILREMKNVRAVYDQEGGIEGEFRLRKLRLLAGTGGTLTLHRENGLRLMVDVETCYFSPRLSTERLRIAERVLPNEHVLNMFAGVGPFSILIARRRPVARVFSCELNDAAFDLHIRNNRLNKVEGSMMMLRGDAKDIPLSTTPGGFDRVLMPHPSRADAYLPLALTLARPGGEVHYYRHVTGRSIDEARINLEREVISIAGDLVLRDMMVFRKVREIGPRYVELVADLIVAPVSR